MMDEQQLFQDYPSAKTILDTIDRIGQSLEYFTERINRVPIVPLGTKRVPFSATLSANECQTVPIVSLRVPHGTRKVLSGTDGVPKIVPIWETLGLSRRTYFRHKKRGLI